MLELKRKLFSLETFNLCLLDVGAVRRALFLIVSIACLTDLSKAQDKTVGQNTAAAAFAFDPAYGQRRDAVAEGRPKPAGSWPKGRETYLTLARQAAQDADLPFDLVDAVIAVESDYDPQALGDDDAIGLMQVRPATIRDLGFEQPLGEAFAPKANLDLGLTYLSGAWKLSNGKICETLTRYRFGWMQARPLPDGDLYCKRVLIRLAANGSALGADIQLPGLAEARAALRIKPRQDWADHDKKVKDIDRKFGGEKFGIISE